MVQGFGLTMMGKALTLFQNLKPSMLYEFETLAKHFIESYTKTGIKHSMKSQVCYDITVVMYVNTLRTVGALFPSLGGFFPPCIVYTPITLGIPYLCTCTLSNTTFVLCALELLLL